MQHLFHHHPCWTAGSTLVFVSLLLLTTLVTRRAAARCHFFEPSSTVCGESVSPCSTAIAFHPSDVPGTGVGAIWTPRVSHAYETRIQKPFARPDYALQFDTNQTAPFIAKQGDVFTTRAGNAVGPGGVRQGASIQTLRFSGTEITTTSARAPAFRALNSTGTWVPASLGEITSPLLSDADYALEFWVKPASLTGGIQVIMESGYGHLAPFLPGTLPGVAIKLVNNELYCSFGSKEGNNEPTVDGVTERYTLSPADVGQYMHVMCVMGLSPNYGASDTSLYVNGVRITTNLNAVLSPYGRNRAIFLDEDGLGGVAGDFVGGHVFSTLQSPAADIFPTGPTAFRTFDGHIAFFGIWMYAPGPLEVADRFYGRACRPTVLFDAAHISDSLDGFTLPANNRWVSVQGAFDVLPSINTRVSQWTFVANLPVTSFFTSTRYGHIEKFLGCASLGSYSDAGPMGMAYTGFGGPGMGSSSVSFDMWVKPTSISASASQVLWASGDADAGVALAIELGGILSFTLAFTVNGTIEEESLSVNITGMGYDFMQIVAVIDYDKDELSLYIDGLPVARKSGGMSLALREVVWNTYSADAYLCGSLAQALLSMSNLRTRANLTSGGSFVGDIAVFSVTRGALSDADVLSRFAPSLDEGSLYASWTKEGIAANEDAWHSDAATLSFDFSSAAGGSAQFIYGSASNAMTPSLSITDPSGAVKSVLTQVEVGSGSFDRGSPFPRLVDVHLPISVELCVRPESFPTTGTQKSVLYQMGNGIGSAAMYGMGIYYFDCSPNVCIACSHNDATVQTALTGSQTTMNQYHHIVCSYNPISRRLELFVDGDRRQVRTVSGSILPWSDNDIDAEGVASLGRPSTANGISVVGGDIVASDVLYEGPTGVSYDSVSLFIGSVLNMATVARRDVSKCYALYGEPAGMRPICLINNGGCDLSTTCTFSYVNVTSFSVVCGPCPDGTITHKDSIGRVTCRYVAALAAAEEDELPLMLIVAAGGGLLALILVVYMCCCRKGKAGVNVDNDDMDYATHTIGAHSEPASMPMTPILNKPSGTLSLAERQAKNALLTGGSDDPNAGFDTSFAVATTPPPQTDNFVAPPPMPAGGVDAMSAYQQMGAPPPPPPKTKSKGWFKSMRGIGRKKRQGRPPAPPTPPPPAVDVHEQQQRDESGQLLRQSLNQRRSMVDLHAAQDDDNDSVASWEGAGDGGV